jgi:hypothetical protein
VPGEGDATELSAAVERFAGGALCARLARATDSRREERFAFPLDGGVLVTGVIDVLAREPGGQALIVDYKSDRLAGADPTELVAAHYSTQRTIYSVAALHSGSERVEVVYCFLELPEEPVTAVYGRSDLHRLQAELGELCAGVLRSEFVVTQAPHRGVCSGCPAEGGLCSWPLELTRRVAPDRLF